MYSSIEQKMPKGVKGKPKGSPKSGGRKKGTPNEINAEVREAFRNLVHKNVPNFQKWITRIAQTDPDKAMDIMFKVSEYFIPKLQRTELTGADGGEIKQAIVWTIPNAKPLDPALPPQVIDITPPTE
jgi:hypothetical protein